LSDALPEDIQSIIAKLEERLGGAADKIKEAAEALSKANKPDGDMPTFTASDGTQASTQVVRAVLEADQEAIIRNIDQNIQRLVEKTDQ
jgi:uncharacterized protein (DUF362 family)